MVFLHCCIEAVSTFDVFSEMFPPWRDNENPLLVNESFAVCFLYRWAAGVSQSNSRVDQTAIEEHKAVNRFRGR